MITRRTTTTSLPVVKADNTRGIESGFKVAEALVAATPTIIGLWDLEVTHTEEKPPGSTFYRPSTQVDESVIGQDARTLVKKEDFTEGGKYRCVVKLLARMEGHNAQDPWMMGSGWLIEPDLIVTAGHMSFDWDHKFGFAKEIKAYIGYYGRDHTSDPSVQFRHGKTVSTPAEWIKAPRENYDVSFIRIDKPFTGIKPFVYSDTPAKGNLNLGVVGYPGDLISTTDGVYGEQMYEMFLPTEFDLAASNKLLQYEIDTFGGNSGSPVIVKEDMKVIGVHVLGGAINSASVIGPLGNVFEQYKGSFLAKPDPSFDIASKVPSRVNSFRVVSIPSKNDRDSLGTKASGGKTESLSETSANLLNSLRSAVDSSTNPHPKTDEVLGKLQSLLGSPTVNAMSDTCNGAEGLLASLQFLLNIHQDTPANTEGFLTALNTVAKHKSTIEKVGKRAPVFSILKFAGETASQIAAANDESVMDHIVKGLNVTVPMVGKELPKLGSIGIPIAAIAASTLRSAANQAAGTLTDDSDTTSANATTPAPAPESAIQGNAERATLAEAALHGVMRLDKDVLKQNKVYEKMQKVIQPLAPIIQRADPMLSTIMQPTVVKVALGALKASVPPSTPTASADQMQATTDTTQGASADTESLPNGIVPKIGIPVQPPATDANASNGTVPAQSAGQDNPLGDAQTSALSDTLVAAHPDLAKVLPGMVKRGMHLGKSAFSKATTFGLPILLGEGRESAYSYQDSTSPVFVSGLAHRALLAEAALQVVGELPVDVIKSLEVPDLKPILNAFNASHDEGDQLPQQIAMGVGAAAGAGAAVSSGINTHLTHSDKQKDQAQKEQELDLKRQELEKKDQELNLSSQKLDHDKAAAAEQSHIQKTQQNLDAQKAGLPIPHPDAHAQQQQARQAHGLPEHPQEEPHHQPEPQHEHPAGGEEPHHQAEPQHEPQPHPKPTPPPKPAGMHANPVPHASTPAPHQTEPATHASSSHSALPPPVTHPNQPRGPSPAPATHTATHPTASHPTPAPKPANLHSAPSHSRESLVVAGDPESEIAGDFLDGFESI